MATDPTLAAGAVDLGPAALAWHLADTHCRPGCDAYHRVCLLLRVLGLAADPHDQWAFFRDEIARAVAAGARSILISGTSDTGMPELVVRAAGETCAIMAMDRCATPLHLVRAQPWGRDIEIAAGDILTWSPGRRFDLIATHSFFGQFAPPDRPRLLRRWFDLLAPGGRVVTVNRLRPAGEGTRFDPADMDALAAEAADRYAECGGFEDAHVDVDRVRCAVRHYLAHRTTHPVRDLETLRSLFTDAGFALDVAEEATQAARTAVAGPGVASAGTYARIVARRPG